MKLLFFIFIFFSQLCGNDGMIFLHIPKTGGVTLSYSLEGCFPPRGITAKYGIHPTYAQLKSMLLLINSLPSFVILSIEF